MLFRARLFAGIIALLTGLDFVGIAASAQTIGNSTRPRRVFKTGILTDRISSKDFLRWDAVKRVVFAEDFRRQPFHPALRRLWEQLDQSGHAVYIELCAKENIYSMVGGAFHIEQFDPRGIRHVAVIRLYPMIIDLAYTGVAAAHPNGFIPFLGLSREERYAEVLGHELAHAVHILSDLTRARIVKERIQQTNEEFLLQGRRYGYLNLRPEMQTRILLRDAILKELEGHANAVERTVWKELVSGRKARMQINSRN